MKPNALTLKNMIRTYYDSKADQKIWGAFYIMCATNFITYETWTKFFEACRYWVWDEDKQRIVEMFTDKPVEM